MFAHLIALVHFRDIPAIRLSVNAEVISDITTGRRYIAEVRRYIAESRRYIAEVRCYIAESRRYIAKSCRYIAKSRRYIAKNDMPNTALYTRPLVTLTYGKGVR